MARTNWTEEMIIQEVESLGMTFIKFIEFKKSASKFIVQCSHKHEPYGTNLNTLLKGRKSMGCPECKRLDKIQVNINKIDYDDICKYVESYDHIILSTRDSYRGLGTTLPILCLKCGKLEYIPYARFRKRVHKCQNCIAIRRYNRVLTKCLDLGYTLLDDSISGTKDPIHMICSKGHQISPSYDSFIDKDHGCDKCLMSKGERRIERYLRSHHIDYISHYRDHNLIYKKHLEFDFYLPQYDYYIEYDGIQHYEPIDAFRGQSGFDDLKIKDNLKDDYCNRNSLHLIRIPYWDYDNIESILDKEFAQ